jgi:glycosyltransferase involved in cell wall biosynthesis
MKYKLIRTATVSLSLDVLLKGQLAFLNQYFHVIAVSGADEHLEMVRNREKVQVYDVKMVRKISPLQDLISLFKLYRLFKKEKPTIVHSITPKAGLLSMTAARMAGVPVRIHTFTGLLFPFKTGLLKKLLLSTDKLLCKFATHIIPEGQGIKEDLIQYNVTQKPLEILAHGNVNGIDTTYFSREQVPGSEIKGFKEKYQIQEGETIFVFIGRKVKDKGVDELIQAFGQLIKAGIKSRLIFVGPYEKSDELSKNSLKSIEKLSIEKNIINLGFEKNIRLFLAVSDVLILPSYREGFPNVLLQALAMEIPCISTDICGCNEIIKHQVNGLLIEKKSTSALYDAMHRFVSDTKLLQQQKLNCRNEIVEKYANQVVWKELLKFYEKTIENVSLETTP